VEFLIIGIAVFFNFMAVKYKLEKKRYADGVLDILLLAIITFLFAGSFGGLVVATIASALISISLYFFPPKLPKFDF
jgi:hypothetical protein